LKKITNNIRPKIVTSTDLIFSILFCAYIMVFLFIKYAKSMVSNTCSDILNNFAEFLYGFITSNVIFSIFISIGIVVLIFYTFKNNNWNYKKLFLISLMFISLFLTYVRGKEINDLKYFGYKIIEKIEEFYLQNDRLPKNIQDMYDNKFNSDTLKLISTNFYYNVKNPEDLNVKNYSLFLKPEATWPTIYLYDDSKEEFITHEKF